ncbi:hypothetical protein [Calditerricola yamamurae]
MSIRILWIALLGLLLVVVMEMVVVVAQQTGSLSSTAWDSLSPLALENELGKSEMVIVDLGEPKLYRNGHDSRRDQHSILHVQVQGTLSGAGPQ